MKQRHRPAAILLSLLLPSLPAMAQIVPVAVKRAPVATVRPPLSVRCANQDDSRGLQEAGAEPWGLRTNGARPAGPLAVPLPLFTQVSLAGVQLVDGRTISVTLRGGKLISADAEAKAQAASAPDAGTSAQPAPTEVKDDGAPLSGAVLHATLASGATIELTVCDAAPDASDAEMWSYNLQYYNSAAKRWQNVCTGALGQPAPRAIALSGVWDQTGTRREVAGAFTFACPRGALSKCVQWGYKPWRKQGERTLAEYHQACTRMARADYCGNGKSHHADIAQLEVYDDLGIQKSAPGSAKPFEAGWSVEGAYCLNRTRLGAPVTTILRECPGRFVAEQTIGLSDGESCKLHGIKPAQILIRNRSQLRKK